MSDESEVPLPQSSRRQLLRAVSGLTTLGVASGVSTDAVAADPGEQQWAFDAGVIVYSSPTVVDGTVFVGSFDDNLHAVDAADGTEQWVFETDHRVDSSPTVVDGTVFFGSWDNNLYAVDAADGTEQWVFETGGDIQSSPTVADGTVYVGSFDQNLYAVDAADGTEEWAFETGRIVSVSSPTVVDGTVFVGSLDGSLYAVDAETGDQQWAFETADRIRSSPTVVDGTVFVGSRDNNLHAVDAADGTEQWVFETGDWVDSSPTVVDGTVFVGSRDGNLYAVNGADGIEEWAFETRDAVMSSPTVADGTVFIGSRDDNLYAVNAADGTELWSLDTGGSVESSPTVADGTVFVGSRYGPLYAVDAGVNGASEGSRVMLGTLGHHDADTTDPGINKLSRATSWVQHNTTLLTGGVGTVVVGGYLYHSRRDKSKGETQTETAESTSEDSASEMDDQSTTASDQPTADSESIKNRHRDAAEAAIETAVTAESNNNLTEAADAYSEAISEYNSVLAALDAEATEQHGEIEAAIESTRADLETVKTRHEQRSEVIEALQSAERSLQEAIIASIQNDQTVARIRFRQARDTFEDAYETITESEEDLLTEPLEVSVKPDREPSSKTLSELPVIPEQAATALDEGEIETVDELDSSTESPWTPAVVEELVADETINEDVATALTLLSWWHGDNSCEFETAEAVARRQQQADYGFTHLS